MIVFHENSDLRHTEAWGTVCTLEPVPLSLHRHQTSALHTAESILNTRRILNIKILHEQHNQTQKQTESGST